MTLIAGLPPMGDKFGMLAQAGLVATAGVDAGPFRQNQTVVCGHGGLYPSDE